MTETDTISGFAGPLLVALGASVAAAHAHANSPIQVGDAVHGQKLYAKACAQCHGDDAEGGPSAPGLRAAAQMNLRRDDDLVAAIRLGRRPDGSSIPDHRFRDKMSYLDTWDLVQVIRDGHLGLRDFFPQAARYTAKAYEIDEYGLERITEATGAAPPEKGATVFTFFEVEGEDGAMRYVPQDPVLLDRLSRDHKIGYLVFLPFRRAGYQGDLGIAMDATGKILRLQVVVPDGSKRRKAEALNRSLKAFVGLGKKGQKKPFRARRAAGLQKEMFAMYLRAMETVTMYDREERERTWADE